MLSPKCSSPCAPSATNQECPLPKHPQCNHTPPKLRTEFKSRVNHFLFDNLSRVLCELYFQCEHESNAIQSSQVLSVLSDASLRFAQLHRKLTVLANATQKNTKSIAWNVSSFSPQVSAAQMASRKNILELLTSPHTDLGAEAVAETEGPDAVHHSESKRPSQRNRSRSTPNSVEFL